MKPDPEGLEEKLIAQAEAASGTRGNTIVAFCLLSSHDQE
jgi:hypothetical protein